MNPENQDTSPKPRLSPRRYLSNFSPLALSVFVAVFATSGIYLLLQSQASPGGSKQPVQQAVNFSLKAPSTKVANGEVFAVEVWEDSLDQPVNALQANVTYPADTFEFIGIDTAGSRFEISAQSSGGDGIVNIGRGHAGQLTGKQLVAKITFKSKATSGKASISFAAQSVLLRATDNTDILEKTSGIRYSLTAN